MDSQAIPAIPTAPKTRTSFKSVRAAEAYLGRCCKHYRAIVDLRCKVHPVKFNEIAEEWNAALAEAWAQVEAAESTVKAMRVEAA